MSINQFVKAQQNTEKKWCKYFKKKWRNISKGGKSE